MVYTLGEAARATGKAKSAISQAITAGRLSAKKDEFGRWQIEPVELHRVYRAQNPKPNGSDQGVNPDVRAENDRLKLQVDMLERLVRQVEGERDSLREQNTRLTALLPAPSPPRKERRRWWPFTKRTSERE